ncbi:MAG TPA: LCP family protein, partial [Bacillota bacterium]
MAQRPSFSTPGAAKQRRPRVSSRRRRLLLAAAYLTGAALAFGVSLAATLAWQLVSGVTVDPQEPPDAGDVVAPPRIEVQPDEPFNILIIGTDAGLREDGRRGARRSDTLMLASYDPLTSSVSILSIPRDTRVEIPVDELDEELRRHIHENPTKISHTHAFGGPAVSMAAVGALLDVPVHRYVRVNLDAFINIVDLMGGVHICVPKAMHYEDPYQDLYIHLEPGCRMLDGNEAMQYARYRQDSDLARIARQQEIIRALIQRGLDLGIIPRLGQIVDEVVRQVDTNLSEGELLNLVAVATRMAAGFDPDDLVMNTIPG